MKIAALIVAAGRGSRAGGPHPKQWQDLLGRTIAEHTVGQFLDHPRIDHIMLVLHPDDIADKSRLWPQDKVLITPGGAERAASVRCGLQALVPFAPDLVLIHDVARPCLRPQVIDDVIAALADAPGAAPALMLSDALWRGADGQVQAAQDRQGLYRAQTPQGFDFQSILQAHQQAHLQAAHSPNATPAADDVDIARRAGIDVQITMGDEDNIKITHPQDFERAAQIVRKHMNTVPDIRLGNGFDVHAFGPGDSVTLCGVKVPHDRGLVGHSDADVAMHAITDAIFGALADGDIGQHFPPSDPQWKGAASDIFLRHAAGRAADRGFELSNIDCTLICETPKIGPHAQAMRQNLAQILGLEPGRVSVKATTSERLGFTGRQEGIACIATALLVKS